MSDEVRALLKRKQKINTLEENQFTETYRWLVDAVELLLRMQEENQGGNNG